MKSSKSVSKQPRKQRKLLYSAPLHLRRKQLRVHLSRELRNQLHKRSALVRKGDRVRVLKGGFKGLSGLVTRVDYKRSRVFVAGAVARRQAGREMPVGLRASNLLVLEQALKK